MQEVLVLPRKLIAKIDGFVSWSQASSLLDEFQSRARWVPRNRAERLKQWIQPIPCAIFRDGSGRCCVFRYPLEGKRDIRLSLIVGGHIDSSSDDEPITTIFLETLKREILEEVGATIDDKLKPIGMAVDSSSLTASRHVGFVYEVEVESNLKPRASEEFSIKSKYSGRFFGIEELPGLRSYFDPWSLIVFSQYLERRFEKDMGRQAMFTLFSDR